MPQLQPDGRAPARFPTTHWSRVTAAAGRDDGEAREALAMLCQAYWYPIYALVRHHGFSPEQAGPDPGLLRLRPGAQPDREGRPRQRPLPPPFPAGRRRCATGTWPARRATRRTRPSGAGLVARPPSTP